MHIYSTLTSSFAFAVREQDVTGNWHVKKKIYIQGGAQLAQVGNLETFTPNAVRTEVTDEDYQLLLKDWTFNHFVSQGMIIADGGKKQNPEKMAGKMELPKTKGGAPVTPSQIEDLSTDELKVKES
jgi:hypothetical protein